MWLLEQSVRIAIEQAQAAGITVDANQQAQFEAQRISAQINNDTSRLLTVAGETAQIAVEGVLTKAPSFFAMLFGGGNTTYSEIISALAEAEQNANVARADLMVDSPGGSVDGLFDAIAAIDNFGKPIRAVVSNMAASAAYALVSQTDEIVATNGAARFGSIGILFSTRIDDKEINITSTNAPKKAPDLSTEAGKAIVREELDSMHDLFVNAIAKGRNISEEKINAKFGQGAVLLAGEALKRGMIDSIAKPQLQAVDSTVTQTAVIGGELKSKVNTMDLKELQAKYPDVYSAAVQVGVDMGVNDERERVKAHLLMGKETGATAIAIEAIENGEGFGPLMSAKYISAGMNRSDTQARIEDDAAAAEALKGAGEGGEGTQADEDAEANLVAAGVAQRLGATIEA